MTVYRVIPNSEVAPDAPVLSDTLVALRDNITATFEGDPTAPKIVPAAMLAPTAGNTIIWRSEAVNVSGTTYTSEEAHVIIGGTVRVTFDYTVPSGSATVSLIRNTTTVFTEASTPGLKSKSVDVSVSLGDVVYIQITGEPNVNIENFKIKSGVLTAAIA